MFSQNSLTLAVGGAHCVRRIMVSGGKNRPEPPEASALICFFLPNIFQNSTINNYHDNDILPGKVKRANKLFKGNLIYIFLMRLIIIIRIISYS